MPTKPITALRADLRRLADRTSALNAEATTLLGLATAKQWVWSPSKAVWSMALTLDHLNSVNGLLLPRLEEAIARLRAEGRYAGAEPRYSIPERFFIRMLSPNPPFHLPVPPPYVPKLTAEPATEAGERFLELIDRIERCIEAGQGLDLQKARVPSPASPLIRLTVGAWLEATVGHNDYHWMQVRALVERPDFPKR
jgi:hypothetical protein